MSKNIELLSQSRYGAKSGRGKRRKGINLSDLGLADTAKESMALRTPADYASLLKTCIPVVDTSLPTEVSFTWDKARLMTYNQLLHSTTYISLSPYKKAWHKLCHEAILQEKSLHKFQFSKPVIISVNRSAKRLVDHDGLEAMFKFIIDGFVLAGLIIDDSDKYVTDIKKSQSKGDYSVAITFTLA